MGWVGWKSLQAPPHFIVHLYALERTSHSQMGWFINSHEIFCFVSSESVVAAPPELIWRLEKVSRTHYIWHIHKVYISEISTRCTYIWNIFKHVQCLLILKIGSTKAWSKVKKILGVVLLSFQSMSKYLKNIFQCKDGWKLDNFIQTVLWKTNQTTKFL